MSRLTRMFSHTANILRVEAGPDEDDYGNPMEAWVATTSNVACRIQHHNSWEDREGRMVYVGNWRAYLPPGVDVKVSDRLEWPLEGKQFEILAVEPVHDRTHEHHQYLFLQEVE